MCFEHCAAEEASHEETACNMAWQVTDEVQQEMLSHPQTVQSAASTQNTEMAGKMAAWRG